jgi:hypothetical protein
MGRAFKIALQREVRIGYHRAQFPEAEQASIFADAQLGIERRMTIKAGEKHQHANQRQKHRADCNHHDQVDQPLSDPVEPVMLLPCVRRGKTGRRARWLQGLVQHCRTSLR